MPIEEWVAAVGESNNGPGPEGDQAVRRLKLYEEKKIKNETIPGKATGWFIAR